MVEQMKRGRLTVFGDAKCPQCSSLAELARAAGYEVEEQPLLAVGADEFREFREELLATLAMQNMTGPVALLWPSAEVLSGSRAMGLPGLVAARCRMEGKGGE
jgi:hypothetical protein